MKIAILIAVSCLAPLCAMVGIPADAHADELTPAANAAAQDIRDIRPPIEAPARDSWPHSLALGAAAFLLVSAAFVAYLMRTRRKRPLADWEVALTAIEDTATLMQEENAYAFSIAISEAVRTYLEKRFRMRVTNRTTLEFLGDLSGDDDGPLAPYRIYLEHFLDHCDLAKYGRYRLTPPQMAEMYDSARRLVDETRPVPERHPLAQRIHRARAVLTGARAPSRQPLPEGSQS